MRSAKSYSAIDEFVDAFSTVYGQLDKRRTVEQMWLQVVEEASSVAEAVREANYVEMMSHLANTFCWFCGVVAKCHKESNSAFHFEEDFSSIIWNKYPNKCPLCQTNPCQCLIKRHEINQRSSREKTRVYENVREIAQGSIEDRVKNLDKLVAMFEGIFSPAYFVIHIEEITFHFTEEVGEVAEQIRELNALQNLSRSVREKEHVVNEFTKEMADVFSWMCGILIKTNLMISDVDNVLKEFGRSQRKFQKIKFSEVVKKYYLKRGTIVCRTCGQKRCDIKKHKTLYSLSEPT